MMSQSRFVNDWNPDQPADRAAIQSLIDKPFAFSKPAPKKQTFFQAACHRLGYEALRIPQTYPPLFRFGPVDMDAQGLIHLAFPAMRRVDEIVEGWG